MQTLTIDSQSELRTIADAILQNLNGRTIVAFYGQMGAGKTTLIREVVALLGSSDVVTSPTFALVNQYSTADGNAVYHFDFYRINRLEEAFDLGYEEYFYSGDLCLIEWSEKIGELLPEDVMTVTIHVNSEVSRTFEID